MILHKPTLRRGEPVGGHKAKHHLRVKVLGSGAIEQWHEDDVLELPSKVPATDEEINSAICLDLSIREVRAARRGCEKCGGCR